MFEIRESNQVVKDGEKDLLGEAKTFGDAVWFVMRRPELKVDRDLLTLHEVHGLLEAVLRRRMAILEVDDGH